MLAAQLDQPVITTDEESLKARPSKNVLTLMGRE
jgi:hypothetical protein